MPQPKKNKEFQNDASRLEQSAVLWHISITNEYEHNLKRVQTFGIKLILGGKGLDYYDSPLKVLNLQSLKKRDVKVNCQVKDYVSKQA